MNFSHIADIVIAICTMVGLVTCMSQIIYFAGFKKGAIFIADYNHDMSKWMQVLNIVLIALAFAIYNYFNMTISIWASVIAVVVIYGYVLYGVILDRPVGKWFSN